MDPPDEPSRGGGDFLHYVERPVPTTSETADQWTELEVDCDIDDGEVYAARVDGRPFALTDDERAAVAEAWVWEHEAREEAARSHYEADAYDRAGDR